MAPPAEYVPPVQAVDTLPLTTVVADAVRAAPGLDTAGDLGRHEVLPVLEVLPSLRMIATNARRWEFAECKEWEFAECKEKARALSG